MTGRAGFKMAAPTAGSFHHSRLVPALLPCFRKRVLMLGDSFIKRLSYYVQGNIDRGCLGLKDVIDLRWYGVPGATVDHLVSSPKVTNTISNFRPDVIILQVVSNDLCIARSKADAWAVGYRIVQFAEQLLTHQSVRLVLILSSFHRTKPSGYTPDVKLYNQLVDQLYHYLYITTGDCPGVKFFTLGNKLLVRFADFVGHDGIHLNPAGLRRYYRALRYAILHGVKSAR